MSRMTVVYLSGDNQAEHSRRRDDVLSPVAKTQRAALNHSERVGFVSVPRETHLAKTSVQKQRLRQEFRLPETYPVFSFIQRNGISATVHRKPPRVTAIPFKKIGTLSGIINENGEEMEMMES
jgi:hypothetical protein